jgi:hypothetical protein
MVNEAIIVLGIFGISIAVGVGIGYGQALFEHLYYFDEDNIDD